ncbi:hypothetical protein MFIFM68171_06683 [Madurella fahalii]|uniref:Uncharacterized protein n=1 Tax=Madurella fahalii TaxID=1157608 RepID=A0ABQ0GFD4_9PEZI
MSSSNLSSTHTVNRNSGRGGNSGYMPSVNMPSNNSMNSRSRSRASAMSSLSAVSSRHPSRAGDAPFSVSPASFASGRGSGPAGSRGGADFSRARSAASGNPFSSGSPPADFTRLVRQHRNSGHSDKKKKKKKKQVLRVDPDNLSTAAKIGIFLMGTTPQKLEKAARAGHEKRQRERDRRRMQRGGGDGGGVFGSFED